MNLWRKRAMQASNILQHGCHLGYGRAHFIVPISLSKACFPKQSLQLILDGDSLMRQTLLGVGCATPLIPTHLGRIPLLRQYSVFFVSTQIDKSSWTLLMSNSSLPTIHPRLLSLKLKTNRACFLHQYQEPTSSYTYLNQFGLCNLSWHQSKILQIPLSPGRLILYQLAPQSVKIGIFFNQLV